METQNDIFRRELQAKYDFLKPTDLKSGLMEFGFDCDDGWLKLLDDTFGKIDEVLKKNGTKGFRFVQVKEKLGGLRLYANGASKEIYDIINEAERVSEKTCELCGKPGAMMERNAWFKTLCKSCGDEYGYRKLEE